MKTLQHYNPLSRIHTQLRRVATALAITPVCQGAANALPPVPTLRVECGDNRAAVLAKAASVVPTTVQLSAQRREFIAFIHFGPNTFNAVEWGTGLESPACFTPDSIDTDQWCRLLKEAGMKMVILKAKHHDGFALWPSRYTTHSIASSPYMDGNGDVMKQLSASCLKYGLDLGIYLSPCDLWHIENPGGLYGNGSAPRTHTIPTPAGGRPFAKGAPQFQFMVDDYNAYYLNQLYELLTEYGPISEVWLDGAHPKRKGGQGYDYASWRTLIRTLAPGAAIFGREDLRWCGNECGDTRQAEWNSVPYADDPRSMTVYPDRLGDLGSARALAKWTAPYYIHYQPAETDTSIRDGWFWRDDTTQHVRTAAEVFDIYERSVGGNSILLLNVPPSRTGRLAERDEATLTALGRMIGATYGTDLLKNNGDRPATLADGDLYTFTDLTRPLEIHLGHPIEIDRITLQEPVATHGERIEGICLELRTLRGKWVKAAAAPSVGYKRILRFAPVTCTGLRLKVTRSRLAPKLAALTAHRTPVACR